MKNFTKLLRIIALVGIIAMVMAACGAAEKNAVKAGGGLDLSETVTITWSTDPAESWPSLTAVYNGNEPVSYQWKRDGTAVGENSNMYTPDKAGNYTVTVSAAGYKSKTSAVVSVGPVWTKRTGSNDNISLYTIAWGNGRFVAGGREGKMAYSSDGENWTTVTDSTFGNDDINAIAWGNNRFVAGGSRGRMAYSADGETWTAVTDSTFGSDFYDCINAIAWGKGRFVAVGDKGKMAYSGTGKTWTRVTDSTFGNDGILAIAWETVGKPLAE